MGYKHLITSTITKLVDALAPRFIGRDQDHLLSYGDELVDIAYSLAWDNDQPLYQFRDTITSNAGASTVGTSSGVSVQAKLDSLATADSSKVSKSGDTMTGKLTNSASLHITSGTAVFGAPTPESLYWNYTYPGNTYVTMDKAGSVNDASHVFTQASRAKWEVGATTEAAGASPRYHIKKVRNPDANPANDQFVDLVIGDYDTETFWFTTKVGIGGLPTDKLHVISTGASSTRLLATIENFNNTGSGSQSSALQFKGASTGVSWITGNDYGLNGGNNWFVAQASGAALMVGFPNGVVVNGSTLAATEAFRVDSTTGGLLLPRLTTTQRDALGGKNAGLTIFNTTSTDVQYWDSVSWKALAPKATTLAGYGITDAQPSLGYTPVNKAGDTMTGGLKSTGIAVGTNSVVQANILDVDTGVGRVMVRTRSGNSTLDSVNTANSAYAPFNITASTFTYNDNTVWHAGNFDPATKANLSGASFTGGISMGSTVASSTSDLSRHLALWGASFGFNVTGGRLNYVTGAGGAHAFNANGTDVASISASSTTAFAPLVSSGSNAGLFFDNRAGTARQYGWYGTGNVVKLNIGGIGDVVTISEAGAITANGGFQQGSSLKLKTIDGNIPYGLAEVEKLVPIIGRYKSEFNNDGRTRLFLGAEPTKEVIPEVVFDEAIEFNDEKVASLDYVQLVPVLVKAVQELSAKVKELENAKRIS